MRVKVNLENKLNDGIYLPRSYNSIIQGIIYNSFDKEYSDWLHNKGYQYQKNNFKMFCFSNIIQGKYCQKEKKFWIPQKFSFIFTSPVLELIEKFSSNALQKNHNINGNIAEVSSVEILKTKKINSEVNIKTLSPITVYRTMDIDGGKKTRYFSPLEEEFWKLVTSAPSIVN